MGGWIAGRRGTFILSLILAGAAVTDTNKFLFKSTTGAATIIGLGSGFFWNSELYLGYSWDSGFIRNGKSGGGLILAWYKSF
jgi:hypothetical protein